MKFIYLIPEFPGQTHILFWREIEELRARGHDVEIVSTRRPASTCPHTFASEPCTYLWPYDAIDLLDPLRHPTILARQLRLIARLPEGGFRERLAAAALIPASWKLARLIRERGIDFAHGHSFANTGYILRLAQEISPFRYGLVLHGAIENYGHNHAFKLSRADLAAGVNALTTEEVRELAPPGEVDTLPCGVPLDVFGYVERDFTGRMRLLTVARLAEVKGIQFVIQALGRLRDDHDFEYVVIGQGEYRDALAQCAIEAGIADRVRFAGALGQDDVAAMMGASHLAVLASHGTFETTAIFVREAMATGLPAVMSDIGDARSMIRDGIEGFVTPQCDVAALSERIHRCLADRQALQQMSIAAHRKARAEYSAAIGPERLLAHVTSRTAG